MVPEKPRPPIAPAQWQELLRVTIEDILSDEENGYAAELTAQSAGLNEDEVAAFVEWFEQVEADIEARKSSGIVPISTERLMQALAKQDADNPPSPDAKRLIDGFMKKLGSGEP